MIGWKGCIREGTRGRAFAAPAPATAIAARRCNAMATANETRTVCRSKTAFCLRFGGRGLHGRGLLESGSAHARAHTSPQLPLFSVVMVCRRGALPLGNWLPSWAAAAGVLTGSVTKLHGGTLDGRLDYSSDWLLDYRWLIERVSRTVPSRKRRAPQATSADGDQGPTGPVSKGQRPRARVQKASVKRASTLQQPASLRAVNWRQGTARQLPTKSL